MADVPTIDRIQERKERETWTKTGPLVTRLPDDEVIALEDRAMAILGDPSTLGFWAFATGTWITGTVIGGAFGSAVFGAAAAGGTGAAAAGNVAIVPVLLIFAGFAQFVAGMFAYRRGSPLLGNLFCCFGAFGVTAACAFLLQASGALPIPMTGNAQILAGLLLESFAFIALGLMVAALRTNMALVAMLGLLAVGFCLAGIPNLAAAASGGWLIVGNIGGWFMVGSALCAYYLGLALVVNSAWKRAALPLGGSAC